MSDRVLNLHSIDTEREVLASMLISSELFDALGDSLKDDLFTDAQSRQVFGIMRDMQREGKVPELTEVGLRLAMSGGNIGEFTLGVMPSYELTKQRIGMLVDLAVKRRVYKLCCEGMARATDPTATKEDIDDVIQQLQVSTSDGKDEREVRIDVPVRNISNAMAMLMEGRENPGIMTGLHVFDRLYGFGLGDLVIVAGESSHGKSTLATSLARNIAGNGVPVCYYSLEMSKEQLTARIMARDIGRSSSRIMREAPTKEEFDQYWLRVSKIADLPIYFDERSKTSFEKICLSIRRMVKRHGVRVVFIDYLQILANGGRLDSREQLIGDMARSLKILAVELKICIVALSQMNRSKEDKGQPSGNRLRGSGQIKEACDMLAIIYCPQVDKVERFKDGRSTRGLAKIVIDKGRCVGIGEAVVRFDREMTYICDIERGDPQEAYREKETPLPF